MTRRAPGILVVLVLAFAAPAHASAPGSDDLVEWGRTSGIAGLQDGLSVRRDGRATASPRGDDVGRRRLSHAAMTLLRRDLRAAHLERFTRPLTTATR